MVINGKTKKFGIVGYPVEHSFSPMIHNTLAEELGINMVYMPLGVKEEYFSNLLTSLKTLEYDGCNVTVPYKLAIMEQLDFIDNHAKLIGAVNTVKLSKEKTFGYNTDFMGLKMSIEQEGLTLKGQDVLVIGAGGAARAASVMCASEEAKSITIVNRTLSKAKDLCQELLDHFTIKVDAITYENLEYNQKYNIAIQTTSIGMYPNINETPISTPVKLSNLDFVVDIVYNPRETKFMKDMSELGVKSINGIGMLFYQAIKAFEIWHDLVIDESVCRKVYKRFLDYLDQ